MSSTNQRRTAAAIGTLLLLATTAAVVADSVLPDLNGANSLAAIAGHRHRVAIASFAYLVAAISSVSIALGLYPTLKRSQRSVALAAVAFRTIEATLYCVAVVSLLSLRSMSAHAPAGASGKDDRLLVADGLRSLRDHATLVGVFAFCAGALCYYALLHRSHLIPRWLSIYGLAAAPLLLTACVLALVNDRPITRFTPLIAPIAFQEIALAVTLLFKGFDRPSASTTERRVRASRRRPDDLIPFPPDMP